MGQKRAWLCGETSLDEMMADPIVLLLMRGDGLSPEEVRRLFRTVSDALREREQPANDAA